MSNFAPTGESVSDPVTPPATVAKARAYARRLALEAQRMLGALVLDEKDPALYETEQAYLRLHDAAVMLEPSEPEIQVARSAVRLVVDNDRSPR